MLYFVGHTRPLRAVADERLPSCGLSPKWGGPEFAEFSLAASWRAAVAIKAAKGRDNLYKLTSLPLCDAQCSRYWRVNYRHLGKQKTFSFGVWPETSLAEARERRDTARKLLARGEDPGERIKLDRIAAAVAAANSFQAVADEWPAKMERENRSAVTMKKPRWLTDSINASIWKRQVPAASMAARGDHSKAESWPFRYRARSAALLVSTAAAVGAKKISRAWRSLIEIKSFLPSNR